MTIFSFVIVVFQNSGAHHETRAFLQTQSLGIWQVQCARVYFDDDATQYPFGETCEIRAEPEG